MTTTPEPSSRMPRPPTLRWIGGTDDGCLELLDQRRLPTQIIMLRINTTRELWDAIRTLAVRGAPAIGVAAAYGIVLAARAVDPSSQSATLWKPSKPPPIISRLHAPPPSICSGPSTACSASPTHTAPSVCANSRTDCSWKRTPSTPKTAPCAWPSANTAPASSLPISACSPTATPAPWPPPTTARRLAILYEAQRRGIPFHVFADETRPLLQGARLTAWELSASDIDVTLICDNMAGLVMRQKKVGLVIVGADRIAANGDTANKIGTYSVAQLARAHQIPFIVAAPVSTFDLSLPTGEAIPIEERPATEITETAGHHRTAPEGIKTYNPAFDVTPADLITAIVTDRGVISPVNAATIRAVLGQ